jgi:PLP dependent protein
MSTVLQKRVREIFDLCSSYGAFLALAIKTQTRETIEEACISPKVILAENRIQEAEQHFPLLHDLCNERHFIGRLQRNKVKKAVALFDVLESIDSTALIETVAFEAMRANKIQKIFLSVNISKDEAKSGFTEDELPLVLEKAMQNDALCIQGLFTILKNGLSEEEIRRAYRKMKTIFEDIRKTLSAKNQKKFTQLSMGMSDDYRIALEEGASIVRVGRGIFGERQ